jgi:hypothetical protein
MMGSPSTTHRSAGHRTGPIGKLARLLLAGLFAFPLFSLLGPGWSSRFRNPHVLSEPSAWLVHVLMLVIFVILVGALAAALQGPQSRTRWQVGAVVAAFAVVAVAGGIGKLAYGSFWGFPLADAVWWFDVVMLIEQVAAILLAIALGTPGCEIGVWPELIARSRGIRPTAETGLACIVGLHLLDGWEARRAAATGRAAGSV